MATCINVSKPDLSGSNIAAPVASFGMPINKSAARRPESNATDFLLLRRSGASITTGNTTFKKRVEEPDEEQLAELVKGPLTATAAPGASAPPE